MRPVSWSECLPESSLPPGIGYTTVDEARFSAKHPSIMQQGSLCVCDQSQRLPTCEGIPGPKAALIPRAPQGRTGRVSTCRAQVELMPPP